MGKRGMNKRQVRWNALEFSAYILMAVVDGGGLDVESADDETKIKAEIENIAQALLARAAMIRDRTWGGQQTDVTTPEGGEQA